MSDGIERDGFKPGDVVVITGAGGGFGRAFCQRFGAMGAKIAAWDVNEKLGEETVRLVRDAGGDITFFKADLSRREDVAAAIDGTLAKVGAPYCIINNASIYPRAPTVDMSADAFELAMRVNIMAPFLIVKAFGPKMMENKRGVIINISSGAASKARREASATPRARAPSSASRRRSPWNGRSTTSAAIPSCPASPSPHSRWRRPIRRNCWSADASRYRLDASAIPTTWRGSRRFSSAPTPPT